MGRGLLFGALIAIKDDLVAIFQDDSYPLRLAGRLPGSAGSVPGLAGRLSDFPGTLPGHTGSLPVVPGTLPEDAGSLPGVSGRLLELPGSLPERPESLSGTAGSVPGIPGNLPDRSGKRGKVKENPKAQAAVEKAAKAPDDTQAQEALRQEILKILKSDPGLAASFQDPVALREGGFPLWVADEWKTP